MVNGFGCGGVAILVILVFFCGPCARSREVNELFTRLNHSWILSILTLVVVSVGISNKNVSKGGGSPLRHGGRTHLQRAPAHDASI
jgi:hypothetical protein